MHVWCMVLVCAMCCMCVVWCVWLYGVCVVGMCVYGTCGVYDVWDVMWSV